MASASLLPIPRAVFFNANGDLLVGGYVYTYLPGTTTPATTWQDANETTPNSNPIILDSAGSALIYGSGNYQITVTDSLGNQVPGYSGLSSATAVSSAMYPVFTASTVLAGANALLASGVGIELTLTDGLDVTGGGITVSGSPPGSTVAFDMRASTATVAIALANNESIQQMDNTGVLRNVAFVDAENNLVLGDGNLVNVTVTNNVLPVTDDLFSLGASANRWTAVWAANGTIQTSDPSQKTSIKPAPAIKDALLKQAAPITHGWRHKPKEHFQGDDIWSFDALALKTAFEKANIPFGGVVADEKGVLHVAPMQILAALWRIVMEQQDEIDALKSK